MVAFACPALRTCRLRRDDRAARMSLETVKVCGVVSEKDAVMICRVFRDEMPDSVKLMLGMIVWPRSKRSVDRSTARAIARMAWDSGATPVGVFVDETTDEIAFACSEIGLSIAQLHGHSCRLAVRENPLPPSIGVVGVVDVAADGSYSSDLASGTLGALWSLYDAKGGGTGRAFDWDRFSPPSGEWFLAGGLDAQNVGDAVRILQPSGLDVASGVAGVDGCLKDEQRLREFFQAALSADEALK